MNTRTKLSLLAISVLTAMAAQAQPAGGMPHPMMGMHGDMCEHEGMAGHGAMHAQGGQWNPARMQAMQARHQAQLKAQLKLTPEQEPAWKTFVEATKIPAGLATPRPDPAELAKLSTPQRIDRMKAIRAQRQAELSAAMDQHGEAVKAFYAVLTPQQQQVFDAQHGPAAHAHHPGPKPAPKQN